MNTYSKRFCVAVFFLLLVDGTGQAAVGRMHRGKMYDIENQEEVLNEDKLGILGLTLWRSTLQEAQRDIGPTPIQERHYASGRDDSQLCYSGSGMTLLLNSQGEKGEIQEIDEVIISTDRHIPETIGVCAPSLKLNNQMTFMGGLHLGMTSAQVQEIWGKPGKVVPNILIYEIRRQQHEFFTDDVSLYMEFKNHKLSFVKASRAAIH